MEHRKCRILANGSMQPITLKGVAQAAYSENLLDIVDLFFYIKTFWLLKIGTLPGFGFSPRGKKKTCIKIFFVFIIPPSKITHVTGNILVKPYISSSCILIN